MKQHLRIIHGSSTVAVKAPTWAPKTLANPGEATKPFHVIPGVVPIRVGM